MMKYRILLIFLMLFSCLKLSAQKLQMVSGSYTYFDVPKTMSMEEAEHIALERCKAQILAERFGTVVGVVNFTQIENKNGESSIDMLSLGESEVKGEWVQTVGEPEFRHSIEEGKLIVSVKVTGRVREMKSAPVDLLVRLLRNGYDERFESSEFNDGDFMYMQFMSPVDGYLAIYLHDGEDNVYCLLPYYSQTDGRVAVKANEEYVFFSKMHICGVLSSDMVDEYQLTCSRQLMELNRIYVVFSPSPFYKAVDDGSDSALPRSLTFTSFQKWLQKCRRLDEHMIVRTLDIRIKP